jgi:hypothetical protein
VNFIVHLRIFSRQIKRTFRMFSLHSSFLPSSLSPIVSLMIFHGTVVMGKIVPLTNFYESIHEG